jgi:hypothetical protein
LPVAGKTLAELQTRAQYFSTMIALQCRSLALSALGIIYHPKAPSLLSHVYFAISEAYKAKFLYPEKGTDPTKQAGLVCATIAVAKPLHSPTKEIDREEYIYMNQMFAMRCACGIVEHPFHLRAWHDRRRFYKQLEKLDLPIVHSKQSITTETLLPNGELIYQMTMNIN